MMETKKFRITFKETRCSRCGAIGHKGEYAYRVGSRIYCNNCVNQPSQPAPASRRQRHSEPAAQPASTKGAAFRCDDGVWRYEFGSVGEAVADALADHGLTEHNRKLVREGPLKELLSMQRAVKVRVQPDLVDGAIKTLASFAPAERLTETDREEGWLVVHTQADCAEEVNRLLAGAGIYASGLESGSDLEMLFLQLTGDQVAGSEGTFVGLGGPNGSAGADSGATDSATTGKGTAA